MWFFYGEHAIGEIASRRLLDQFFLAKQAIAEEAIEAYKNHCRLDTYHGKAEIDVKLINQVQFNQLGGKLY